jgi:hypothetical protein
MWRVAQFDTLCLRLIKVAARVVEMKTMIRVQLPTSCPRIFRVSHSGVYRASSPDRRGAAPLTLDPVPSTRKPPSGPTPGKDRRACD